MTKVRMVCENCGGEEVRRDAYAAWNIETQQWELSSVFDNAVCEGCDGEETNIEEEPIDEDEENEEA